MRVAAPAWARRRRLGPPCRGAIPFALMVDVFHRFAGKDAIDAGYVGWSEGECFGIRQHAAEVEAGEEAKHLTKSRAFTRMERPRKREHGRCTKEQACTFAVQTRRRKQK